MKIAITGGSGFVGSHVMRDLKAHTFIPVSTRSPIRPAGLDGCDAVIHLAGEPVAQRWTRAVKQRIHSSRVDGTRRLAAALREDPPQVLVSASAVGYYDSRGDVELTETSAAGDDFLARVAIEWEREAFAAEALGVRVVALRIGIALGHGGALQKMLTPFRLGLGGRLGGGSQWFPWIHIGDLTRMIGFALEHPVRGAMNAVAPEPATNAAFTRELARVLHRPAILPVPKIALKLLYGEMADTMFSSLRVIPEAALRYGFEFRFPRLRGALEDLL